MSAARGLEEARLIREGERHADAERRSWSFLLQLLTANILFSLAPKIPHAQHLFGALTAAAVIASVAPGQSAAIAMVFVYRRFGSDARVYRVGERLESLFLYSSNVAIVFATRDTWSVIWILCPFTTVFWAMTKPFDRRVVGSILSIAHGGLAIADLVSGNPARAIGALLVGVVSYVTFEAFARIGRKNLALEAERNVAEAKLNEATLDAARRRVANTLRDGIGAEITQLARELESESSAIAEHARSTVTELGGIAEAPREGAASWSALELRRRIDEKCRPLCTKSAYASALTTGAALSVDAERALSIVRVAQELTRNAVVHGGARHVQVELAIEDDTVRLRVVDDGSGLSDEQFARATGGLQNAKQWLRERGGLLALVVAKAEPITVICATLPRES